MTAKSTLMPDLSRERFLKSFEGLDPAPQAVASAAVAQWPETPSMRRFLDSFSGLGPAPRPIVRKATRASSAAADERERERIANHFRG